MRHSAPPTASHRLLLVFSWLQLPKIIRSSKKECYQLSRLNTFMYVNISDIYTQSENFLNRLFRMRMKVVGLVQLECRPRDLLWGCFLRNITMNFHSAQSGPWTDVSARLHNHTKYFPFSATKESATAFLEENVKSLPHHTMKFSAHSPHKLILLEVQPLVRPDRLRSWSGETEAPVDLFRSGSQVLRHWRSPKGQGLLQKEGHPRYAILPQDFELFERLSQSFEWKSSCFHRAFNENQPAFVDLSIKDILLL